MARARTTPVRRTRRERAASPVQETAQRLVDQIEQLVAEIGALRADNDALRSDLVDAVELMRRASGALDGAAGAPSRRGRRGAGESVRTRPAKGRARARAAVRGRVTPDAVTPKVIMAAIGKLGDATASEIAAEISRNGVPVSGRAIRFLAERAGARIRVGEDGQRRYSVG